MSQRLQPIFSGQSICIIPAKLDAEHIERLTSIAEANGAVITRQPEIAQIIVTTIHAYKRLLRHVDVTDLNSKMIVTPEWITKSVTEKTQLPSGEYNPIKRKVVETRYTSPSTPATSASVTNATPELDDIKRCFTPSHLNNTTATVQTRGESDLRSRFAVHRLSPLVSPNQKLLLELGNIMRARWMDGDNRSALSYSRAISVLKAYRKVITSSNDVASLAGVGPKILKMVDEFIDSGMIEEAERVKRLRRTQALLLFSSVYSIGPTTARHLYDDIGLHSLSDLQDYANSLNTPQGEILRLALGIREDLNQKIPRNEVERIVEVVANELEAIQPGCMHTICGGYRRGKLESNDVDVVFTHPLKGTEKGLCKALVARLQAMGVVTSLLHTSSFSSNHDGPGSKRFSTSSRSGGLGGLDTALTVFRLPNSNMVKLEVMEGAEEDYGRSESIPQLVGPHRRLDIIFAPIDAYYTAVVGWTGSTQFERDLRLWANTKGLRFDSSGILSLNDGRVVVAKSEHEVFRILGLDYIDPVWRNADL